ncbi:hypothetical protein [Salinicoccus roseus]|uniref:hypothetical protein n=1 Tax=Salinicoccus roseus TaxID=45670 RepID=UPI003DA03907
MTNILKAKVQQRGHRIIPKSSKSSRYERYVSRNNEASAGSLNDIKTSREGFSQEFDRDFNEGIENLIKNYNNTLRNLVNK